MIKVSKTDSKGQPIPIPDILLNQDTQIKRESLINAGTWLSSNKYKSPYQNKEVRKYLKRIYNNKCVYCEQILSTPKKGQKQREDAFSVEHYRPRSDYWWLGYSIDNLLPTCQKCNSEKSDNFSIIETKIEDIRESDLGRIHLLAIEYNTIEKPLWIHPQIDDPEPHLIFTKFGEIKSNNHRCHHVIIKCDLNRLKLRQKRKKLYDDFEEEFSLIQLAKIPDEQKLGEIHVLFENFVKDALNIKLPFLAFRRYMMKNDIWRLVSGQ